MENNFGKQIFGDFSYVAGDVQAGEMGRGGGYSTKEVPLRLLEAHPDNRAIHQDLVSRYAESIKREGLAHPPLVRRLADGHYQIISGHHRVLAYKLLDKDYPGEGWDKIPVTIKKDCDDKRALRLLSVTNIRNPEISKEERGQMVMVLDEAVAELRKKNPEVLKTSGFSL